MISLSISAIANQVFHYWRNPYLFDELVMAPRTLNNGHETYGSESHALDVIQVFDNSLPGASTVHAVSGITRRVSRAISLRKPISQDLIDRL